MMQPLTGKEVEYIVDSISNEDLLIKQNAVAATTATNPAIRQICQQFQQVHEQNYNTLLNALNAHLPLAPTQPGNQ
ncbi:hypothetical protein ACFOQM_21785 [Paenibacillus sp. GCM10012307]|uniref:Spore coat protein n=1 Tax=Paenibacillus roseus TaxID=2798579 RepID=A0A934JB00_9BACL|nr:hypothetical protein [Paenibacillus roseus]MBJ6363861.1 hypothetical protein [Paenibacillus roseus]